eukprot:CAMPEP_0181360436 /NCGR_PEP_ID=MMETSP1106-20121128/6665_1 /TAXON_ID=81844 /ORGANISM="Mantoniella antarctica, Strain SL-175" /LENGTH=51 /DNA_ID=CAMNT_0023473709 /DNA_START=738 /DNA_END=893 /DNA_ORIENTATION=+
MPGAPVAIAHVPPQQRIQLTAPPTHPGSEPHRTLDGARDLEFRAWGVGFRV